MKKSNFYLLYSGDKSLLSNEVNKLKKNLNITSDSIYYDIENVSDIIVEASTIGMFDPYKFIVIDSGSYFLQKSEFDISLLDFKWKIYYFLCKKKIVIGVISMIFLAEKLKKYLR